jgi:hypothetical protein
MKIKHFIFIILPFFVFTSMRDTPSMAAGTAAIDQVRNKPVLEKRDLDVIDNFIADSVRNMLNVKDLTANAKLRSEIVNRKSSPQGQYAQKFSESTYKYISEAFNKAQALVPRERQNIILINLLILADELQDNPLRILAASQFKTKSMAVRYYALRCLTNPTILKQLNSGQSPDTNLAGDITGQLIEIVESSNPDVLALIAQFAAGINIPEAETLLLKTADTRIQQYADWTVQYELADGTILKMLESKISSSSAAPTDKTALAGRFAQLYSYVLQRYIKGKNLDEAQRRYLATVLIETEDKCISKLSGQSQTAIKQAIEKKDKQALLDEHNRLLGSAEKQGQLPLKLNFTYVTTNSNSRQNYPIPLPDPPINQISRISN